MLGTGRKGVRGYGGGGRGRVYTYRYTITTRMTPALRWAAMRAILMFHNCEGQSHESVSTNKTFEEKGEPKQILSCRQTFLLTDMTAGSVSPPVCLADNCPVSVCLYIAMSASYLFIVIFKTFHGFCCSCLSFLFLLLVVLYFTCLYIVYPV